MAAFFRLFLIFDLHAGLGEFQTELEMTVTLTDRKGQQRDLTDDEIERAIAEIQSTIQKFRR